MTYPFYSKKNRLIVGYLEKFIVLLSFFLTATAESASAKKAYSRSPDGGDSEKESSRKKRCGQGEKGKKPSSLPIPFFRFFPLRSPLFEHLK